MLLSYARGKGGAFSLWLALLAIIVLMGGCRSGSISGAAGNQVDPAGGPGMQRGGGMDRESGHGGGY